MKRTVLSFVALLFVCLNASAFKTEEVMVYSYSMEKEIPVTIITPDSYRTKRAFPVVYLLHGFSDSYRSWASRGGVGEFADRYDMILVMPDGGFDSWYFDSKISPEYQYETFVSEELVDFVDENYKTICDRTGRAITGLSMGGHGALYLAIRHQDLYGSVGSTSGGVDIRPFHEQWNIEARLGCYFDFPENWEKNTVINMTHLIEPDSLDIIIDCGTEDFFYKVNCNLHEKLLREGIKHDFYTRPGHHNWKYWSNSIKYQMLFFSECFARNLEEL